MWNKFSIKIVTGPLGDLKAAWEEHSFENPKPKTCHMNFKINLRKVEKYINMRQIQYQKYIKG